ncbi:NYN domain-containing protein [Sphingobacterium multivorum]|uniref:NYN domain n=1 Tax=Sphingobacterium multivorum TaxID=28454 RepID=A0A2X2L7L7_SPHMU|nr:NYN domain-containing protein [Sphingobacterium multivorum]QRQ59372.1 NYN domain-containing protein [Sphingobacterium multivorum]SPZ85250.1 NYN domain [Sphingobacterium multivorum]
MAEHGDLQIAILIDADNVSYRKIEEILNEVKRYGIPTIKRIYGDWTNPYVEKWKDKLLTHAITPIQQYSYTQGKNSTDSALIIDAMDILHSDRVDGFCIVSSDSDFTRLATRLRESGKLVIGIGEKKTPKPFIASCDKFIYVEIFEKNQKKETVAKKKQQNQPKPAPVDNPTSIAVLDEETLELLKDTVDDTADENGWAFLGEIGSLFNKRKPDFDARNYGYDKMSHLFKAYKEDFEIEERNTDKSRIKHYYIRNIIKRPLAMASPAAAVDTEHKTPATPTPSVPSTETTEKTANQNTRKKGRQDKKRQDKTNSEPIQNEAPKVQEIQEQKTETPPPTADTPPTNMLFPSEGNKITTDDVKKSQIRITKEFKPLFPTKSQKLRIMINAGEYECNFTYRGRGFHVLKLGKDAATKLGLSEGIQIQIVRLNEVSFSLQNKSV